MRSKSAEPMALLLRVQLGAAPEGVADVVLDVASVWCRGQRDVVLDTEHAGHARGEELGLVSLVLPLRGAGQGDEAVPDLRIHGHRDEAVEHEGLEHVAARSASPRLLPSSSRTCSSFRPRWPRPGPPGRRAARRWWRRAGPAGPARPGSRPISRPRCGPGGRSRAHRPDQPAQRSADRAAARCRPGRVLLQVGRLPGEEQLPGAGCLAGGLEHQSGRGQVVASPRPGSRPWSSITVTSATGGQYGHFQSRICGASSPNSRV